MNTETTTKIVARIAAKVETAGTFREAATAAAWDACQEARQMGWSEATIAGMMQTFAHVAADMIAAAA